jgi:pyruvate dehydrogenase E1 component beta subunit
MSAIIKAVRPASRLVTKRAPLPQLQRTVFPVAASLGSRNYAKEAGKPQEMTVREALTDAMRSEMRSNEKVFILGEEVAQYNGA